MALTHSSYGQIRTVAVLSGSAHSEFESNLQSHMATWLHFVRPLTRQMFEVAAFDPEDWARLFRCTNPGCCDNRVYAR